MSYSKEFWDWTHFLGSFVLCLLLSFKIALWEATVITFLLGMLKEVGDEWYKNKGQAIICLDWLFDPNGWDLWDIGRNSVGIALAIIIRGL